jgi:hypothetical protein
VARIPAVIEIDGVAAGAALKARTCRRCGSSPSIPRCCTRACNHRRLREVRSDLPETLNLNSRGGEHEKTLHALLLRHPRRSALAQDPTARDRLPSREEYTSVTPPSHRRTFRPVELLRLSIIRPT